MSILIGTAVLAEAIRMLGGTIIINNALTAVKSAPIITMALTSMITFSTGMLLGSGNALWYALGSLVSDATAQTGAFTVIIALPMQLSSGTGRCVPPVAGVVIAISGMAEPDTIDTVKGCSIPVVVMRICNLTMSHSVV